MASEVVIKAERLGKRYSLGQVHSDLLSERIGKGFRSLGRNLRSRVNSQLAADPSPEKDFWALREVSFEIERGEVVGIIGRNGAGKSTLLKILSRITEPTEGRAELRGRIGSLLEVGTGFHPELTGRENIFLNGAILGMKKAEIKRKFDEIVSFAEVEKFIDTPVKRYSSGMYVRLAFAVAAHLETEILLVDEVLAVGDAQFQKKCLGKMGEVAREGRTVLFVSHNMPAVGKLCPRAVLLSEGRIKNDGSAAEVINIYSNECDQSSGGGSLACCGSRQGDGRIRFSNVGIIGGESGVVCTGEPITIELRFDAGQAIKGVDFFVWVSDPMDEPVLFCSNYFSGEKISVGEGTGEVRCRIGRNPLLPGRYWLNLDIYAGGVQCDYILRAHSFNVVFGDYYGSGTIPSDRGKVLIEYKWGKGISGEE